MPFLALLGRIPFKDYVYGGIIIALLIAFGVYTRHERVIGAAHEVAVVQAAERANDAKVAAINSHNQTIENQANAQIQALSSSLANANSDLASRLHYDTSSNRPIIVPEASGTSCKPSIASAAQGGASPSGTAAPRSSIETQVLRDDLQIALSHNLELQSIEKEFQQVR